MTAKLLSTLVAALLLLAPLCAFAQEETKTEEDPAIALLTGVQDNSFLLEEGYNQEPGQVQHINLFLRDRDRHAWAYAFTQEWPIGSMKHQISYTIPATYVSSDLTGATTDLGDIAINYRYQLIGNGESRLAVSPRLSVIFPTADDSDSTAVEVGIPISRIFTRRILGHTNLAARFFTGGGEEEAEFLAGQSLILAVTPRVNLLVEALWTGSESDNTLVISPGFRWAINRPSGMQIVPGVAYVIGVGEESEISDSFLFYLSFEHAFGRK